MEIIDDFIVEQLHQGDMKSFEWIYGHYYELLCRFAYRFIHDRAKVEEIVDDVMFNLWDRHEQVVIRNLRQYLIRGVKNRCLNELRSAVRQHEIYFHNIAPEDNADFLEHLFADTSHPLGELLEKELDQYILKAINELPEECRRVFLLSREEQLSYEEIASRLGISTNTVKYHIKHAIRYIDKKLRPYLTFVLYCMFCE